MPKTNWKFWVIIAGSFSVILAFQNCSYMTGEHRQLKSDSSLMQTPPNDASLHSPSETQ